MKRNLRIIIMSCLMCDGSGIILSEFGVIFCNCCNS